MDYKKKILDSIKELESLAPKGKEGDSYRSELEKARKMAEAENDHRKLFLMWQTFREVVAEETGGDSSFEVRDPEGKVHKFKTIEEAEKAFGMRWNKPKKGYKTSEVNNNPAPKTQGRKFRT